MKIPINRSFHKKISEVDIEWKIGDTFIASGNERDKIYYTGTYWLEGKIHEYIFYYKDEPILKTNKYWVTVKEKNTIYDETYIDVFDMSDNKIATKQIKIIHSHNHPEDELPQLGDIIKQQIRNIKIKELL